MSARLNDTATSWTPPKKRRRGRWLRAAIFAPFRLAWWFASRVERATGILFTLIAGALLVAAGLFLSSTVVGVLPGIPLIVLGGLLLARALY